LNKYSFKRLAILPRLERKAKWIKTIYNDGNRKLIYRNNLSSNTFSRFLCDQLSSIAGWVGRLTCEKQKNEMLDKLTIEKRRGTPSFNVPSVDRTLPDVGTLESEQQTTTR
jgi:hypothetical protein